MNDLKMLGKVRAPGGFEQKLMAEISLRKREKVRVKYFRLSMAGAVSALAVLVAVVNLFVHSPQNALDLSNLEKKMGEIVPITETMNYSREIRSRAQEPTTVYILEQVSNRTDANTKY